MQDFKVIQCQNCGGAMYSDQKTSSYLCPYCGSTEPWTEENYYRELPIVFRHKPVEVIDGLLKLSRVDISSSMPTLFTRLLSKEYRLHSVAEKLALWDTTTFKAFAGAYQVKFNCPICNGQVNGDSRQNFFTCPCCGNKLAAAAALKPGTYKKDYVMGVGSECVPERAIPFSITPEQAQSAALQLFQTYPQDFTGQEIEKRIVTTMTAVYIPFKLADLSLKARIDSNQGELTTYQEITDWPCPSTTLYDIRLLDQLLPWDFCEVTSFDPAFAEGLFQVAAIANNISRIDILDYVLSGRLIENLQETFNLSKIKDVLWARDFREHKHGTFLLPVYYIDRRDTDGARDVQIRLAVNGQTGKAAALILQDDKLEVYRTVTPHTYRHFSAESTVCMKPTPVQRVKAPFLHQVLPFEKALKKKGLGRLFFWR